MAEAGTGEAGGYVAFISYSHKDAAMGRWLHRKLEGYRLPKRLVGTEGEDGEVPARLTPIFRDRDELPAAGDLSERVRAALAVSRNLIVLCSPNSAASPWVAKEIATFRELHPGRPVFTAIVAGEPGQCFSPSLLEGGVEPLAADLRTEGDGRRLGLLKLVAGLAGVGLDALIQRDAARRLRRVTYVTAVAVAAMLIMALLTAFALNARAEAERQRVEAEGLVEFMLTDLRKELKGVGRLDVMAAVNGRALRHYARQDLVSLPADSLLRRTRILHVMGEDDLTLAKPREAIAAFQEAYRTTSSLVNRSPNDPDRLFAHSQSEYWVGYINYRDHKLPETRHRWLRYKELAERLVIAEGARPRGLRELGYAEGNLCTLALMPPQDVAEARRACHAALVAHERVRSLSGGDPQLLLDIANRHAWAADAWKMSGRWDQVLKHRQEQERLARRLLKHDPLNLDYQDFWTRTQLTMGQLLADRGEHARAEGWFADAAAAAAKLLRHDPKNESWRKLGQQIADARKQGEVR